MFGVVCFPELGRDTGRCETQIVVLLIVHETQTQNYNVTFFVRSQHENKQTKVSVSKAVYIQRFIFAEQELLVEWLQSIHTIELTWVRVRQHASGFQFWPD